MIFTSHPDWSRRRITWELITKQRVRNDSLRNQFWRFGRWWCMLLHGCCFCIAITLGCWWHWSVSVCVGGVIGDHGCCQWFCSSFCSVLAVFSYSIVLPIQLFYLEFACLLLLLVFIEVANVVAVMMMMMMMMMTTTTTTTTTTMMMMMMRLVSWDACCPFVFILSYFCACLLQLVGCCLSCVTYMCSSSDGRLLCDRCCLI